MLTIYPPISTGIGVIGWLSIGYTLGSAVKQLLIPLALCRNQRKKKRKKQGENRE